MEKLDIFVRNDDRVEVDVFAWKDDKGEIRATNEEGEVPKDVEAQIIKCIFRRPNYQDSNAILRTASITGEMSGAPDLMSFQDAIIRSLLIEVHYGDEVVNMRQPKINSLHTNIARAAVGGVLDKITI